MIFSSFTHSLWNPQMFSTVGFLWGLNHPLYCYLCQTTSFHIKTQLNSFLWPISTSTILFSCLHIKAECVKQLAGACCRLYLEQPSGPGPPLFWAWWGGNPARLRQVLIITLHLRQAAQLRSEMGWRRAADWQDKKMPQRRGRDHLNMPPLLLSFEGKGPLGGAKVV